MLPVAVISNTVALMPIGIVVLMAPIALAVIANLSAKKNSDRKLAPAQRRIVLICLLMAGLAIGCTTYIGRDYFHEVLRSVYVIVGFVIWIACLVNAMISSESS